MTWLGVLDGLLHSPFGVQLLYWWSYVVEVFPGLAF